MHILIIGYGSIGKRHEEVLLQLNSTSVIDIVTKQKLPKKQTFKSLKEVISIDSYDYFIIASPTNKHYEQLKYIESNAKNKIIFCEKPLFETKKYLNIINNIVYIGYVLRFHPLLQRLKNDIENQKVINVNVSCGQYLPKWRPNTNYKESYSAKKNEGGGVLLDLSHEIDYIQWLFGSLDDIKSYQVKGSDLEIDSDDLMTLIGKTTKDTIVTLTIDYISKIMQRRLIVNTIEFSYELDFIKNTLIRKDKEGQEKVYSMQDLKRNNIFRNMHKSVLGDKQNICTYEEGLNIMNTISIIQEQNNR